MREKVIEFFNQQIQKSMVRAKTMTPNSEEFMGEMDFIMYLERQIKELETPKPNRLSMVLNNQTLISVLGTLAATVWITHHEKAEVITSRAFNLIRFK